MKTIIFTLLLFISSITIAQEEQLSLEDCLELALQNNIGLQRSDLETSASRIYFNRSKSAILPSINANYNYGTNNGRSIDPYTNDYIDQKLNFSNASATLDMQLFRGFELLNSIRRDRFNWKASKAETEEAKQQLVLKVTLAYFQVMNNRDLVELAKLRLQATKDQAERLKILYLEGEGNPADYTDIRGQLSADQASLIDAQKYLESAKLELANLLDRNENFEVAEIEQLDTITPYQVSAEEVYEEALEAFPGMEAKRLRIEAAKKDVAVARSLYSPEISLFAQLNSNYSSVARIYNETGTQIVQTGQFITIDEVNYPVLTNKSRFSEENISYFDQLNNNLNSVVGVSVNIPIFNGFRAKQEVSLKKIQLKDSQLELEQTENDLEQEIKTAYNQMQAAYKNYFILKDQVSAYEDSYLVNEIRYKNGVSNFVEYIVSKNNLDRSRINAVNTYYEFKIRKKILDYYYRTFSYSVIN